MTKNTTAVEKILHHMKSDNGSDKGYCTLSLAVTMIAGYGEQKAQYHWTENDIGVRFLALSMNWLIAPRVQFSEWFEQILAALNSYEWVVQVDTGRLGCGGYGFHFLNTLIEYMQTGTAIYNYELILSRLNMLIQDPATIALLDGFVDLDYYVPQYHQTEGYLNGLSWTGAKTLTMKVSQLELDDFFEELLALVESSNDRDDIESLEFRWLQSCKPLKEHEKVPIEHVTTQTCIIDWNDVFASNYLKAPPGANLITALRPYEAYHQRKHARRD